MVIPLYYIRFFKPPPDVVECNQPFSVVWTIETDLGDESYWQSIPVTCNIASCQDPSVRLRVFSDKTKTKKEVLQPWTKEIKLDYNPMRGGVVCTRLMIESTSANSSLQIVFKLGGKTRRHPVWTYCGLFENNDCLWILPAWTCPIKLMNPTKKSQRVQISLPEPVSSQQAERILTVPGGTVRICEDAFQSIARHVWDCGLGMCSYIFQQTQKGILDFNNKNLIELGSGTALVGIYAAQCSTPSCVYLTDLPEAIEIMEQNVALMPPQNNVEMVVKSLEWGPIPEKTSWLEMPVDIVLLTDVLYNQGSHDVLLDTLDWLVQKQTKILLAYKERNPDERVFFEKLKQRDYQIIQVEEEDLVCEIYWIQKNSYNDL